MAGRAAAYQEGREDGRAEQEQEEGVYGGHQPHAERDLSRVLRHEGEGPHGEVQVPALLAQRPQFVEVRGAFQVLDGGDGRGEGEDLLLDGQAHAFGQVLHQGQFGAA